MTNFEILSQVAARQGAWVAPLSRQQQHLLAVLVLAGGRRVARRSVEQALWGDKDVPEGGVKRVVSELRVKLEPAFGAAVDPIPSANDTYCLLLADDQADVLRFRAKFADARRATGTTSAELMREALREWGTKIHSLYGGQPLGGLQGEWAESCRMALRHEHREAVVHCLRQDLREGRHNLLVQECARLAHDPDALHDYDFVRLWMTAAHLAGLPGQVHQILHRAEDSVARHLQRPLDRRLQELAERIRTDSTLRTGNAMNEKDSKVAFNNHDNVTVGVQTAEVSGNVAINMSAQGVSVDIQREGEAEE